MNRLRALLQAAWDEYVSAHSSPLIITGAGYLWVAEEGQQCTPEVPFDGYPGMGHKAVATKRATRPGRNL